MHKYTATAVSPATPQDKTQMVTRSGLGSNAFFGTPPVCQGTHPYYLEQAARRYRHYQLQGVVRHLADRMMHTVTITDKSTGEKRPVKKPYRVKSCLFAVRSVADGVKVRKTDKGAAFSGLQVCGSVWHCPVCAARITNQRRKEIFEVIVAARLQGYKPILVTLTARHRLYNRLEDQLEAMLEAHRSLWRGMPAERLKERFSILGVIRNLEVTFGRRNGAHPHMHLLVFVPQDVQLSAFAEAMRPMWERAARKHGLTMNGRGFDATDASSKVAWYLAKYEYDPSPETLKAWDDGRYWNEADELARWHTKRGKRGADVQVWGLDDHFSPWQLLEYFEATGDVEAGKLFQRYMRVFHGKQQIHGLGPLRRKLGLAEMLTDQEAAEQDEEEATALLEVLLTTQQWLRVRDRDARTQLLEIVEQKDSEGIRRECLRLFGFVPTILEPSVGSDGRIADDGGGGIASIAS